MATTWIKPLVAKPKVDVLQIAIEIPAAVLALTSTRIGSAPPAAALVFSTAYDTV